MRGSLQDKSYSAQLFHFFLIWLGCFILTSIVAAGLVVTIYGREAYESLSSGMDLTSGNMTFIKWLQIIMSLGFFALPPFIFTYLLNRKSFDFLQMNKVPSPRLSLLTVAIVVLGGPFIFWLLQVNQNLDFPQALEPLESFLRQQEEEQEQLLKSMLEMKTMADFALNFLMIALVPAFVEELLFRGTLQQQLQRVFRNAHLAIFITGAFFSFIHFQFFGFLPRMVLGILFGYLFYWSGNLWIPILAHFLHNGAQVVMVYFYKLQLVETDIEQVESFPPSVTMVSTLLLLFVLFAFQRVSHQTASSLTHHTDE